MDIRVLRYFLTVAKEELIEGTITIGCGEFAAVETLAGI